MDRLLSEKRRPKDYQPQSSKIKIPMFHERQFQDNCPGPF